MSKALKVAALVVGVVALTIATAGLAFPAATAAFLGSIATGLTVATAVAVLGVTASVLSVAAGLTAPKPTFGSVAGAGRQLDFTGDPSAGMPYVMGNARVGEAIIHEASWGDKNKFLGIIGVLSCAGPIMAYDGFYADNSQIAFAPPSFVTATGYYAGYLEALLSLGNRPDVVIDMASRGMPDWDASCKLSSLATWSLMLTADIDNGKVYSGGVPQFTHQVRGVKCYDPRLDSTNGGSGSERPAGPAADTELGYGYSENPWVHHGTYALGRWVNGVRVIGPGLPSSNIDWPSHIEAANVADANGWTISGRVLSTDNKWDVLRSIAQAGGGYPIPTQAKLSCLVNTPRVSLETIQESHVKGHVSVPQMAMRRDRLNGGMARYREPSLAWQVLDGQIIRNSSYLTADGGTTKTKSIDLPLVSDKDQAAQLVGYEIANSRERTPIQVPLDLYWSQYKTGDCLTLNLPSALLFNQKCIIIGRDIDAESGVVTFTFRTEDDAKHAWALDLTGSAPTTTVGSDPGAGDGNLTLAQIQTALLNTWPVGLALTAVDAGSSATIQFSAFTLEYPGQAVAIPAHNLTGMAYSTSYYPYLDATGPGDTAPTFGATSNYFDSLNSSTHPNRINLYQNIITPAAGGAATGGTSAGAGGGTSGDPGAGICLVEDAPLLMANAARDGPGAVVGNGDSKVGDWVYTRHHLTGELMAAEIVNQRRKRARVYYVPGLPLGTKGHICSIGERIDWEQPYKNGKFAGWRWVIDRTVAVANTYFTPGGGEVREGGVLNHNVSPIT